MIYVFNIRRTHGGPIELVKIPALDATEAMRNLPKCVSWDFASYQCSDNPGTGEVYHCRSLECGVHGERNRQYQQLKEN